MTEIEQDEKLITHDDMEIITILLADETMMYPYEGSTKIYLVGIGQDSNFILPTRAFSSPELALEFAKQEIIRCNYFGRVRKRTTKGSDGELVCFFFKRSEAEITDVEFFVYIKTMGIDAG